MVKYCIGQLDGTPCCFGHPPGKRKRTNNERCNFCDPALLSAALLNRLSRGRLVKDFKKLQQKYQEEALRQVPPDVINTFRGYVEAERFCSGRGSEACVFAANKQIGPFKLMHANTTQCILCGPLEALKAYLQKESGVTSVRNLLTKMSPLAKQKALSSRIPEEYYSPISNIIYKSMVFFTALC